eukprot:c845_g1_i1.p1 GENE.c845_g1_i1~~c845_g1_i1.p1  ORF type:complete len:229 (+),score=43.69 c845_g1_i1:33-689(+)
MTSRFDGIDESFVVHMARIEHDLKQLANIPLAERESQHKSILAALDEADGLQSQLEFELRSVGPEHRKALSRRCATYKSQIKELRAAAGRARVSFHGDSGRSELFGDIELSGGTPDRSQVVGTTDRLLSTSAKITKAKADAAAIEVVGQEISEEVSAQGQRIASSRDRLLAINSAISKGQNLTHNMIRRMKANKAMMYFIIVALIVMIALIVYFKWIK